MQIIPIKAPTQHFIPIADIVDNIVLLKDGGAAVVMQSTSVNFSLLSESEQEALTKSYASLLNSLSFPIQIVVRSQRKNISDYITFLKEKEKKQSNTKLKKLMVSYEQFVSKMVKKRNVLEKQFFLIIPFSPFELGLSAKSFLSTLIPGKTYKIPYQKDYVIKRVKTALYPKRDHLIRQVGKFGLKIRQLNTKELIELFDDIYHHSNKNKTESISMVD